jgi:signal transduction histidine kinase
LLGQLQAPPLEMAGLAEALKALTEAVGLRTGAVVRFEVEALPPPGVAGPGVAEALHRIAQEALANVARHARASSVQVRLSGSSGRLELEVADDGAGFEPSGGAGGMGLQNMRARMAEAGGELRIVSRPGEGTRVTASMPVDEPAPALRRRHGWAVGGWTVAAMSVAFLLVVRSASADLMLVLTLCVVQAASNAVAWKRLGRRARGEA